jgi:hypothetical protein
MRRKSRACFWALSASILLLLFLTACGGDDNNTSSVGPPATVTLSPTSVSLTAGDVFQMSVSVLDAQQRSVFNQTVTFTSNNVRIQIANNGALCAGTWLDAQRVPSLTNPIECRPVGSLGLPNDPPLDAAGLQAGITATAGSITSTPVNVFVHLRVTSIEVTPLNPACVAQGGTVQFTAIAKNGTTDLGASVGNISWQIPNGQVASGDPLSTAGKTGGSDPTTVTAKLPGRTPVIASIGTVTSGMVTSVEATFTECPIAKVTVTAPNTNLTGAGATVQLTAVATDTTAADVTNPAPTLMWASNPIGVATVNASGLVTGQIAGTAAVVAGCVPGTCNIGLEPIFSGVTPITVAGTSSTTVYAASQDSTSLIPITTSNNTAGTAIALPNSQKPNSLVFSPNGARAFLGSDGGLMVIDATNNTVAANVTNAMGKVLAVSPDGNQVLIADTGVLRVFNGSANTVTNLTVPNATAADFNPDGSKAYIAAGNKLFILQAGSIPSLPAVPSNPTANNSVIDVSFLASGNSAYMAVQTPPSPVMRSTSRVKTCNNSITEGIGGAPRLLKALPDGTQILEAEDANINAVDVTVNAATSGASACPSITENVTQHNAATSGAPQQLIVTLDSSKAFVTSNDRLGSLLAYDVAGGTTSAITLAGGRQAPPLAASPSTARPSTSAAPTMPST